MTRSMDDTGVALPHEELCAVMGVMLGEVTSLPGDRVPMPYRDLLVHEHDMTPTLERFHRCSLSLRVLGKQFIDGALVRQVLLTPDRGGRPVAFGVIRIFLSAFDDESRQMILACRKPLGAILGTQAIEHTSQPTSFFTLPADETLCAALQLAEPGQQLFGRYNELALPQGQRLAQVVEVLGPVEPSRQAQQP